MSWDKKQREEADAIRREMKQLLAEITRYYSRYDRAPDVAPHMIGRQGLAEAERLFQEIALPAVREARRIAAALDYYRSLVAVSGAGPRNNIPNIDFTSALKELRAVLKDTPRERQLAQEARAELDDMRLHVRPVHLALVRASRAKSPAKDSGEAREAEAGKAATLTEEQARESREGTSPFEPGSAGYQPPEAHFATAYGPQFNETHLTKDEYRSIVNALDQYDFLIDGTTRWCFKRPDRDTKHREARLTVAEFELLREYVVRGGIHRPVGLRPGRSGDPMAAIRLFNSARDKADIATGKEDFVLFQTHKGGPAERRRFEFAPPETISWVLIELADP